MLKNSLIFIKKLRHSSMYRGCRESEILFSNFANNFLDKLSEDDLLEYEDFLTIQDADFIGWLIYNKEIPHKYKQNTVFLKYFANLKKHDLSHA